MAQFNLYQREIAKLYLTTRENIAVQASAGCGKTTLLVGLAHKIKKPHSFCFLAFTKAAAEVLKKRMPSISGNVITTYSLGYKNARNYLESAPEVDSLKANKILDDLLVTNKWQSKYLHNTGNPWPEKDYELRNEILHLQKQSLLGLLIEQDDILEYANSQPYSHQGIEGGLEFMTELVYEITKTSYQMLLEDGVIDFQEMIAWPAMWDDLGAIQFQEIFVDEAQDLSRAQQVLIEKSLSRDGQIIIVGDRSQAIYEFAGADSQSFQNMIEMFRCTTMPMPINYRCGTKIIEHAQEIDPLIQPHPGAPEGEVRWSTEMEAYEHLMSISKKDPDCLVVARTNVLLIQLALKLMNLDKPFTFKRDVLEARLLGLLNRTTYSNPKPPINTFPQWIDDLRRSFVLKGNSIMVDLCDCLLTFYRNYRPNSYSTFKTKIKSFFKAASRQSNITLSTIHAAKGDEAHTVVYWGTNKVPHSMAVTPSQIQQETNLEYIARTRAQLLLIRVELE